MAKESRTGMISLTSCLVAFFLGIIVFGGLFAFVLSLDRAKARTNPSGAALLTVIPAPTVTPTSSMIQPTPNLEVRYVSPEGFSVGAFVKIQNTQGAGLKIRPKPGTGGEVLFIASDGDLFTITDGPDDRNGYSWWKLESVNDKTKTGWGASAFLDLVAPAADQTQKEQGNE